MKTIQLTIADRLMLPTLLPQQGGRVAMLLVKGLIDQVNFTPDEVSLYELRDLPDGRIRWNPDTAQFMTIPITDEQVALLKKAMQQADEREQITLDMVDLLLKIDAL